MINLPPTPTNLNSNSLLSGNQYRRMQQLEEKLNLAQKTGLSYQLCEKETKELEALKTLSDINSSGKLNVLA